MDNKIYNSKGEEVDSYHQMKQGEGKFFSPTTLLLIGGLILFNIGCFVNPGLLDALFRMLDVRLWPWWYFLVLCVIAFFTWRWIRLYLIYKENGFDSQEYDLAARFVRMSVIVSIELLLLVLLNMVGFFSYLSWPFYQMFVYGVFSWLALFMLMVILGCAVVALYYFKEWITIYFVER